MRLYPLFGLLFSIREEKSCSQNTDTHTHNINEIKTHYISERLKALI